jgi:hypothetical protein
MANSLDVIALCATIGDIFDHCLFLVMAQEAANCVQYNQPWRVYNCVLPQRDRKVITALQTDVVSIYRQEVTGLCRLWERKSALIVVILASP